MKPEIKEVIRSFNNSFYWINALVALGDISKVEAGRLIKEANRDNRRKERNRVRETV